MATESEIRIGILKQAAESEETLGWQDSLHNDVAIDLLNEQCVRGGVTDGGTAFVSGIRDKGRKELELATVKGKAKWLSRRLALLIWTAIAAIFLYVVQLECVKKRLSELLDSLLK